MKVEVVRVEDAGYYCGMWTSGGTVNVTLRRGEDLATCNGILIWEEQYAEECFDEWVECAVAGEEGYSAMLVEGNKTVMYTN